MYCYLSEFGTDKERQELMHACDFLIAELNAQGAGTSQPGTHRQVELKVSVQVSAAMAELLRGMLTAILEGKSIIVPSDKETRYPLEQAASMLNESPECLNELVTQGWGGVRAMDQGRPCFFSQIELAILDRELDAKRQEVISRVTKRAIEAGLYRDRP